MTAWQIQNIIELTSIFVFLGWLAWLAVRFTRARVASRQQNLDRLIAKLDSKDLAELLQTEDGQSLIARLLWGEHDPKEMAVRSVRQAIFYAFLGAGCVILGLGDHFTGIEILRIGGVLLLAASLALLTSAAFSYLLHRRQSRGPGPRSTEEDSD